MKRVLRARGAYWGSLCVALIAFSSSAAVFPVVRDDVDNATVEGTLRWALTEMASSNEANVITIGGGLTISVGVELAVGGFSTPLTIEGNGATITTPSRLADSGIRVDRANVTIRNLNINGFAENGIEIGASDCTIVGCTISDCGEAGIFIAETLGTPADNCFVGGELESDRNFLYCNGVLDSFLGDGIRLLRANGTTILNNYIGFGEDGGLAKGQSSGNAGNGITIADSPNTKVGDAGMGNYISGNGGVGILLTGAETVSTFIYGNTIGLAIDGATAVPNNGGIATSGSNLLEEIFIGAPGKGNIISGNTGTGIAMDFTDIVQIQSNYIGLDEGGDFAVGNSGSGIVIATSSTNALIGGGQPGEGNVISGNTGANSFNAGIRVVSGSDNATIQGNIVGLSADTLFAIGNGNAGIMIQADDVLVGGPGVGDPNIVAFNAGAGVEVKGGADFAQFTRNSIYGNLGGGIFIESGSNNDIAPPVIEDVDLDGDEILGTVAVDGVVEVFADSGGQGQFFVGETTSVLGAWQLAADLAPFAGLNFTATVTQPVGLAPSQDFRTSAFGDEIIIPDDGPLQCALQSNFGQPIELSNDTRTCYGSNSISGLRGHEKIAAPEGGIGIVRWWGVASADPNEPCDASLLDYTITFFDTGESEDEPGEVVLEQTVQATLIATELSTFGLTVHRYEAVLDTPVFLPGETGWVSIFVPVTESCRFFWCTSSVGDGASQFFNNGIQDYQTEDTDLSVCLSSDAGDGEGEGAVEGEGEGITDGEVEGSTDGEGVGEGAAEGVVEGSNEGGAEGEGSGDGEGSVDGEGSIDGEGAADGEGTFDGEIYLLDLPEIATRILREYPVLDLDDDGFLSRQELAEYLLSILATLQNSSKGNPDLAQLANEAFDLLDKNGNGQLSVGELRDEAGANAPVHAIDQDANGVVSLAELLRAIQLYNSGAYSCAANAGSTDDGYVPGSGVLSCLSHTSDYDPADFIISLSELLRAIQFYNSGGLTHCPEGSESEDGFCAGGAAGG